jgi:hypothetical protein
MKSQITTHIDADPPTRNGRRITLLATALIFGETDNVFYPSLDVNRLKNALGQILSRWLILPGLVRFKDDHLER